MKKWLRARKMRIYVQIGAEGKGTRAVLASNSAQEKCRKEDGGKWTGGEKNLYHIVA